MCQWYLNLKKHIRKKILSYIKEKIEKIVLEILVYKIGFKKDFSLYQGGGFWATSPAASLAGVFSTKMYLEKTLRNHSMGACLPCDKWELGQVRILYILLISVFVGCIQCSWCILLIQWKLRTLCVRCWEIQRSMRYRLFYQSSISIHTSIHPHCLSKAYVLYPV